MARRSTTITVIASEAKQSSSTAKNWIASSQVLLAMTTICWTDK
jgi:hypothetical protein